MTGPVIPDPTVDLDWSYWNGSIHEVFARNAEKFPDRTCVTETGERGRVFTYKQIHEASNLIGNHLVRKGVERGDVVMIYAHRNVDLVIAIMGTLKAGATFSVLDPQYPADRQVIYLDVSRPRALVVIGKAKGSGLSTQVADWINENLHLRTTIPKLTLADDGSLVGGANPGIKGDVLDDDQASKGNMPDVLVGPDSSPTLSFTSGSEGKPKGVLGRHYSLLYYFPWMGQRFGLSENDKFTMLSGIAHDPIQRDIFTPLFFGAQILIPSQEDIQHERLAEWMKKYKCTVTHLTPAMGQILVGGAVTQFPDLKNAFFVGDILIKRDVRKLQDLAPNAQVINMLGTTETQRAVSYFAVPSRNTDPEFLTKIGDKIPAGKGMKNVQLLVVDRENPKRICDVGESGEIYVRAAGLAEGYLGLDEYTKEKFITNWFVKPEKWIQEDQERSKENAGKELWRKLYKGPRDRLYRTGDLGHYTANGDVECTGRADSQVKIRGFRFELGEVDAHLANNPLVRENVTMLRRDENEEHQLVSYIVPEMAAYQEWLKRQKKSGDSLQINGNHEDSLSSMLLAFRPLRTEINKYLASKLPDYAVPKTHSIIILRRFPLNPNGKIDRPSLPFPKTDQEKTAAHRRPSFDPSSLTQTQREVAGIWAKHVGVPEDSITPTDSFFELGGQSLSAQHVLFEVQKRFGRVHGLYSTLMEHPTLKRFSLEIDRALDPQGNVLDEEAIEDDDTPQEKLYSDDAKDLVAQQLPKSFPTRVASSTPSQTTVLITGATGFLGAFLLSELLSSHRPSDLRVIALVRADSKEAAFLRLKRAGTAFGTWPTESESRISCVCGDLGAPQLGVIKSDWAALEQEVDVIIHNGATVHWGSNYGTLRGTNVLSTVSLLSLAATTTRPKRLTFVSSTAVLDTTHYIHLAGSRGSIPESDELIGSARFLATGYGQTKWSSEYLIRAAGARGLSGAIVRPGYVLGDAKTGTSITDDFLIRLLRCCQQVGCRPEIDNTINMTPVTYVARVVAASALSCDTDAGVKTAQVTPHPRQTFDTFLGALATFGYGVKSVPYHMWAYELEEYAEDETKGDHALMELQHYVTADLPGSTRGVELEDGNTVRFLGEDGWDKDSAAKESQITEDMLGRYLSYLVAIKWMPAPKGKGSKALPEVQLKSEVQQALAERSGRGGAAGKK